MVKCALLNKYDILTIFAVRVNIVVITAAACFAFFVVVAFIIARSAYTDENKQNDDISLRTESTRYRTESDFTSSADDGHVCTADNVKTDP